MYFLLLTSVIATNAGANSCPLENAQYTPLKESIQKLAKTITLPNGCEKEQELINNAAKRLEQLSVSIMKSDTTEAAKRETQTALNSVNTINTIFNSNCGAKLQTSTDFIIAFLDTIMGISPAAIEFGGVAALPYVLGITTSGSLLKTIITIARNTNFDMSKAENRETFIKNSCAFHEINENILSLVQTLSFEQTEIKKRILQKTEELALLEKNPISRPESPLHAIEANIKSNSTELAQLSDALAKFPETDPSSMSIKCEFHRVFAAKNLGTIISNDLKKLDADTYTLLAAKKFAEELDRPDTFNQNDLEACMKTGKAWIKKIEEFSAISETLLQTAITKACNASPDFSGYNTWIKQINTLKNDINSLEKRNIFIDNLAKDGSHIQMSEIMSSRREAEKAIFKVALLRKGPAFSWLKFKNNSSEELERKFYWKAVDLKQKIAQTNPERVTPTIAKDTCNRAKAAWNTYFEADSHQKAATQFCEAFKGTIQKRDYRRLFRFCYTRAVPHQENEIKELAEKRDFILEIMGKADHATAYDYLNCRKQ
jgi:hypothetical protein